MDTYYTGRPNGAKVLTKLGATLTWIPYLRPSWASSASTVLPDEELKLEPLL